MDCSSLAVCMNINGTDLTLAWGPNKTKQQCLDEYHSITADLNAKTYTLNLKDHAGSTLVKPISHRKASELMDEWGDIQNNLNQDLDIHW
ncbi:MULTISPECIES: hypothetical protein [Vibrio]|uniref:Uncharacterized protein n=2 Tax=Vibrio TaxID=662 RepID=A0A241TC42_9VIBR|nr:MULTISPECIES: hypothetical protein [Vibrio]ASI92836.1 hypothetical protein BSZ05_24030 [Vibrio mediterranei]AYV23137.1 hypothetical protein ECB94_17675 [Vibrio mediterranei]EDL55449.1 hypothetical protein VSAK1_22954 [Vibrio mediterranei AK1]KFA98039.1 hypothetical protein HW45_11800 [Vibrio sp. ER1A]MCF4174146.1 hypothetical protein [Vibrio sp. McD22-P3]